MQAGFEVSILSPAHMPDGVVHSAPFVAGIVTSWSVAAGVAHLDVLHVSGLPGKLRIVDADDHHDAAITQAGDRGIGGGGTFAADADQHGIHASALGPIQCVFHDGTCRWIHRLFCAHGGGDLEPSRIKIHRHHSCSRAGQQPCGQQPNQALAND